MLHMNLIELTVNLITGEIMGMKKKTVSVYEDDSGESAYLEARDRADRAEQTDW